MLSAIKKFRQEWALHRLVRSFWVEMEKNLELFYVMDQRQFITETYRMEAWGQVKELELIKKHSSILLYAVKLEEFNRHYKEYKDYEAWYTSDIQNKNPENARKLHHLKHELDLRLKPLEGIIIPAGQDLEKEMLSLGIIKHH